MASGEAVAQHTWKGRESRGSHGKQARTKHALTFSAAVTTPVPSAFPTFPPPPFIALSQFFVPQPHVLLPFQGCARVYPELYELSTDKGFVLLAHSRQSLQ